MIDDDKLDKVKAYAGRDFIAFLMVSHMASAMKENDIKEASLYQPWGDKGDITITMKR